MITAPCPDCSAPYGYGGPASRDVDNMRKVVLEAHNRERHNWKVPPLRWDDRLSADAAEFAGRLSNMGYLRHSHPGERPQAQGENLWMGTKGAYSFHHMMKGFLDERRHYVARALPDISTTGRWQDVGHYSQIIWRTTTAVGCAISSNRDFDFLVCRYNPAGNVFGQRADMAEYVHLNEIAAR